MLYKINGKYRPAGSTLKFTDWYIAYLFCKSLYTAMSFAWDVRMDWGLLRSKEPGKYGLRDKLHYPAWCYYWCIFWDCLLKCTWMIAAGLDSKQ